MKDLKLFAINYTDLSEISDSDKLQVLDFISEANEDQLYALLLSGNMKTIDEASDFMVESVNDKEMLKSLLEIDPGTAVAAGMLGPAAAAGAALATALSVKLYRRFMTGMGKACAGRQGPELVTCRRKFKANAKIKSLSQAKSKCKGDPKCKAKLDSKIAAAKQRASN